ncbi:MAG TPA: class I SAM-dependent methyltransferase [Saprospiraceae bacterium]|nr:class I SAM-dependent methyltransferase [Saprospiraceae bacterium]HNT18997.1 class I SAM-dependent methyltransferase [Saprospiraceae bacterium]
MESSACQSVRWRALHLAEKIDEVHQSNQKRINILSLASGHLRELHYVRDFDQKVERFYGIDQDPRSNEEARRSLPYLQLDIREESILNVIREKYKPNRPLDFIYSAGLFDYLNDKVAQKLITSSFRLLAPGGRILVANFAPDLVEQAYMEAFMDWYLIYRDENQMEALAEDLPISQVGEVKTYRDAMGNVVYLQIIKN